MAEELSSAVIGDELWLVDHYTQQLLATCTEFGWQLATDLATEQAASDAEQALYDRGKTDYKPDSAHV